MRAPVRRSTSTAAQVQNEVDLRFLARAVSLREEHVDRPAAGLDPDLRLAVGDVAAHHRIGLILTACGGPTRTDEIGS
jgi:hypothetical protein